MAPVLYDHIHRTFLLLSDKQVFPRLDLVGWYVTGQGVSDIDMAVNRKVGGWGEGAEE